MKFVQICVSLTLNNMVFLFSNIQYMTWEELDRRLSATVSEDTHPTKDPNDPLVILDARRQDEYDESHIHGAINIHYSFWDTSVLGRNVDIPELHGIPKNREIVTYCAAGFRSGLLARVLRDKGYVNVKVLKDGFYNWANKGKPIYKEHHILTTTVKPQHFLAASLLKRELIKGSRRAKKSLESKTSSITEHKKYYTYYSSIQRTIKTP